LTAVTPVPPSWIGLSVTSTIGYWLWSVPGDVVRRRRGGRRRDLAGHDDTLLLVEAAEHVLRQHGDDIRAFGDRGDVREAHAQLHVLERQHRIPVQFQLAIADRPERTGREPRARGDELLRVGGAIVAVHLHRDVGFLAAGAGFDTRGETWLDLEIAVEWRGKLQPVHAVAQVVQLVAAGHVGPDDVAVARDVLQRTDAACAELIEPALPHGTIELDQLQRRAVRRLQHERRVGAHRVTLGVERPREEQHVRFGIDGDGRRSGMDDRERKAGNTGRAHERG
jgi:hypothetical protein